MISVVMSVKDSKETLAKSIESILNQTYTNYNFLICDMQRD